MKNIVIIINFRMNNHQPKTPRSRRQTKKILKKALAPLLEPQKTIRIRVSELGLSILPQIAEILF